MGGVRLILCDSIKPGVLANSVIAAAMEAGIGVRVLDLSTDEETSRKQRTTREDSAGRLHDMESKLDAAAVRFAKRREELKQGFVQHEGARYEFEYQFVSPKEAHATITEMMPIAD